MVQEMGIGSHPGRDLQLDIRVAALLAMQTSKMRAHALAGMQANDNAGAQDGLKRAQSVLLGLACFFAFAISASALPAGSAAVPEASFGARLDAPEADVLQAVREVAADQIIHGTFSYEKEKILYGAHAADSSTAFHDSPAGSKVFYKVAERVLAPRYFKDSGDIGTLTVRYIVQPSGPTAAIVQIDAVFIDARHRVHASQGSVESAEYAAIQEHLQAIGLKHQQEQEEALDLARRRQQAEEKKQKPVKTELPASGSPPAGDSAPELAAQIEQIRRQVEFRVKDAGTPLKSAPFNSATNLELLPGRAEVVVLIVTPYWYGIETADRHRGWVHRSQLEPVP